MNTPIHPHHFIAPGCVEDGMLGPNFLHDAFILKTAEVLDNSLAISSLPSKDARVTTLCGNAPVWIFFKWVGSTTNYCSNSDLSTCIPFFPDEKGHQIHCFLEKITSSKALCWTAQDSTRAAATAANFHPGSKDWQNRETLHSAFFLETFGPLKGLGKMRFDECYQISIESKVSSS